MEEYGHIKGREVKKQRGAGTPEGKGGRGKNGGKRKAREER